MILKDMILNLIKKYNFEIVLTEYGKFLFYLHLYLYFSKGYQQVHNNQNAIASKLKINR